MSWTPCSKPSASSPSWKRVYYFFLVKVSLSSNLPFNLLTFILSQVMLPCIIPWWLCTFIVPDRDIVQIGTHAVSNSILTGSKNQCSRPKWFPFITCIIRTSSLFMNFASINLNRLNEFSLHFSSQYYQMSYTAIKLLKLNSYIHRTFYNYNS